MDIVIFGAGDIARLADFYFQRDSPHEVVAFTVDRDYLEGDSYLGRPLVDFDSVERFFPPATYQMFVAMSYAQMNRIRAAKCAVALSKGYSLASYVSSRCTFLSERSVGENCFILEDNTIQPYVAVGEDVFIWSGNHIGHDVVIEDHCFVSSHVVLSGHVHLEPYCFLGVNSTVGPSVRLGRASLIGAGAVVLSSTDPDCVIVSPRPVKLDRSSLEVELP